VQRNNDKLIKTISNFYYSHDCILIRQFEPFMRHFRLYYTYISVIGIFTHENIVTEKIEIENINCILLANYNCS